MYIEELVDLFYVSWKEYILCMCVKGEKKKTYPKVAYEQGSNLSSTSFRYHKELETFRMSRGMLLESIIYIFYYVIYKKGKSSAPLQFLGKWKWGVIPEIFESRKISLLTAENSVSLDLGRKLWSWDYLPCQIIPVAWPHLNFQVIRLSSYLTPLCKGAKPQVAWQGWALGYICA